MKKYYPYGMTCLLLLLCQLLLACNHSHHLTAFKVGQQNFQQGHYSSAFQRLLPEAKKGNAQAQYAIGYLYYYGKGVRENLPHAKYWIQQAASQQYLPAKQALDLMDNPVWSFNPQAIQTPSWPISHGKPLNYEN